MSAKLYVKVVRNCSECPAKIPMAGSKFGTWCCSISDEIISINPRDKIRSDCPLGDALEGDKYA